MTARAGLRRPRPMVPRPRLSLQRGYSQAAAAQRLKFCLSQKLTEFRLRVSQFRLSQPWPLASARLRVSFSGAPLAAVLPAATECVDSLCIPSSTKHHNVMQCNQHVSDCVLIIFITRSYIQSNALHIIARGCGTPGCALVVWPFTPQLI